MDYVIFFEHNIRLFKLLGFWKPDTNMKFRQLYNVYTIICTFIWILFLLSQVKFMYEKLDNVVEFTAIVYINGTFTIVLIRLGTIYRNMDLIKTVLEGLNNQLFQAKSDEHRILIEEVRFFSKKLFYLCLYCGLQTYLFFSIIPFLRAEKANLTGGWFPFDCSKSPYYEFAYIFQNSVTLWNVLVCLNIDTFSVGLLMQVGLQCDILNSTINDLEKFHVEDGGLVLNTCVNVNKDYCTSSKMFVDNLKMCIQHYKKINRLSKDIEFIHRTGAFVMFIGGGMIICSGLFQLTVVRIGTLESFMLLSYLACMLIEQFIYCWFGNEILFKSEKILRSIYDIAWYKYDVEFQKILLIFMIQSKHPISIKAGGIFVLSVHVFIGVVRSSYSYFTLLKRIQ